MDVQFQLPLSRNDLLSSNGEHYSVDEVFSVRELVPKLEGISLGPFGLDLAYS